MLTTLWNSPIGLALVGAVCYGIFGPAMKVGMMQYGVSPSAMMLIYGVGMIAGSILWARFGDNSIRFGTGSIASTLLVVVAVTGTVAFIAIGRAFSLPTGYIVLVMTLVAAYPIVSSIIEIKWIGANVQPVHALLGCALVVTGAVVVVTSILPSK